MAHRLETRIEHLLARAPFDAADVETLQSYGDGLRTTFEALRERDARAYAEAGEAVEARIEPRCTDQRTGHPARAAAGAAAGSAACCP